MIKTVKKALEYLNSIKKNDPVKSCEVYIRSGCSHVDGMLCDMKTCSILKDLKASKNENSNS